MLEIPSLVIPTANGTEAGETDLEGGSIFSQMLGASMQGPSSEFVVEDSAWQAFQSPEFSEAKPEWEQTEKSAPEESDLASAMLSSLAASFGTPTPLDFSEPAPPDLSRYSENPPVAMQERAPLSTTSPTVGDLQQRFGVQVKSLEVFRSEEESLPRNTEAEARHFDGIESAKVSGKNEKDELPPGVEAKASPVSHEKTEMKSRFEVEVEVQEVNASKADPTHPFAKGEKLESKTETLQDILEKPSDPNSAQISATAQTSSGPVAKVQSPEPPSAPAVDAREQIAPKVSHLASQGGGKITVSLHPPELGKVELEVLTRGRKVEVRLLSDSAATKEILQSSMADLRTSLASQQLDLVRTDVKWSGEGSFSSLGSNSENAGGSSQDFQSDSHAHSQRGRPDTFAAFSSSGSQPSGRGELDLDRRLNIRI